MQIDDHEFFQGATLQICGSVDIEKALYRCLQYIRRFIKTEKVYLHYIEPKQKRGIVFAMADCEHGQKLNIDFSHPSLIWRYMGDGKNLPEEIRLNRADQVPHGKEMLEIVNLKGKYSLFMMRLILEGRELGVIGFVAGGWDHFRERDYELIRLLKSPLAIALSNSIRYMELFKLKEILANDNKYLQSELRQLTCDRIIGAEFGLSHVMQQIKQVSPLSSPVLLTGETGVGKEVIANTIHNNSPRRDGPLIVVNCGAISETLIDSELFGHEKGSFTGAVERRRGHFERANGGTIFLDEVGELPLKAQVRLLRVLQEKEFEPVGADRSLKVDIRIIAATHRDLELMIDRGNFRRDLYFRLHVFPIHIPPLRERKGDISALTQHFIIKKYRELGLRKIPSLAKGALENLKSYHWPGNIRELENIVERELIVCNDGQLHFNQLGNLRRGLINESPPEVGEELLLLNDVITAHIKKVLNHTRGRIGGEFGAAKIMGVNSNTLRHRMRKLGIPFGRETRFS